MAKYTITLKCGHEKSVQLYGPERDRERKMKWMSETLLCDECQHQERERQNAQAAEENKALGLPPLTGSDKQVAWAETIRKQVFDAFTQEGVAKDMVRALKQHVSELGITAEIITASPYTSVEMNVSLMDELISDMFQLQNKASWWIDHRIDRFASRQSPKLATSYDEIRAHLNDQWAQVVKSGIAYTSMALDTSDIPKEILIETTIYPEQTITEAVVNIKVLDDNVQALTEKNETFRLLVRSLKYRWTGETWQRDLSPIAGTPADRAAELGNALLNAGFPVRIMDEDIRQKAIDGSFIPEHTRWIQARVKGEYAGRLVISWDRTEDFYSTAISLPGAFYRNGVVLISPKHVDVIEEFARLYDFRFSEAATAFLEQAKAERNAAQTVTPAPPPAKQQNPDGLQKILASSDEVLDDLKDDA